MKRRTARSTFRNYVGEISRTLHSDLPYEKKHRKIERLETAALQQLSIDLRHEMPEEYVW